MSALARAGFGKSKPLHDSATGGHKKAKAGRALAKIFEKPLRLLSNADASADAATDSLPSCGT
jgi:hypothetical protein